MTGPSLKLTLSGWRRIIISVFAIALLFRGVFVLTLQDGYYFPDSVEYSAAAANLISHGEFGESYRRSPLYPLFLAGLYALFGQNIVAVRLVEVLMGACLAVVIATIGRRIAGNEVGALAGLLWAIYPLGIFIAGLVYPTGLATMLLACSILCLTSPGDRPFTSGAAVVGGILLGLAALTVPMALVTAGAITVWLVYWLPSRRVLVALLFLAGLALPLAPWTVRNFSVYDRLVIIEPRLVEQLPGVRAPQQYGERPKGDAKVKAILDYPVQYARNFLTEFGYFWELAPHRIRMDKGDFREQLHEEDSRIVRETVFTGSWMSIISVLSVGPMFLCALIGAGAMWFEKGRRAELSLLCLTILSFALGYSFFVGKMRYRIPVEPYIVIFSAYGFREICSIAPKALSLLPSLLRNKSSWSV